jgi:hypothetical protein
MSSALKCNRCHKCFDPLEIKDNEYICWFSNPVYAKKEDYKQGKFTDYLFAGGDRERTDLCPYCAEEHRLFMEGCNLAVHDNDFDRPDQDAQTEENLDECFQKMKREKEESAQGTDKKKDETMPIDRLNDVIGRFMTALFGDWEEDEEE